MEHISQKIHSAKERQKSRVSESRLLARIEKLAKQREKHQRHIQKLDSKLEESFKTLESLEHKGAL